MTAQDTPTSTPDRPAGSAAQAGQAGNPPAPPVRSVDTTTRTSDPGAQDANTDASLQEQAEMPQLPHERDQSVGMTDGNPSPAMQQAYKDVQRGLVDTDAAREAHNVGHGEPLQLNDPIQPGKPVQPDPLLPGAPGPVEPDHK